MPCAGTSPPAMRSTPLVQDAQLAPSEILIFIAAAVRGRALAPGLELVVIPGSRQIRDSARGALAEFEREAKVGSKFGEALQVALGQGGGEEGELLGGEPTVFSQRADGARTEGRTGRAALDQLAERVSSYVGDQ